MIIASTNGEDANDDELLAMTHVRKRKAIMDDDDE